MTDCISGGKREARDAVGSHHKVVAGFITKLAEQFLPVSNNSVRVNTPTWRRDGITLPRIERGAANARDDLILCSVLIRAVVDFTQE